MYFLEPACSCRIITGSYEMNSDPKEFKHGLAVMITG